MAPTQARKKAAGIASFIVYSPELMLSLNAATQGSPFLRIVES